MRVLPPSFIRSDFPRKAVALFFAILIWFAIDVQLHETFLLQDVPVSLSYDPGEVVLDEKVYTVDVLLRGSRRRLETISTSDIRIEAEIDSRVPVGLYFYRLVLTPSNVTRTPPGIRVSSISPSALGIHLDRIVTKHNVPVRVRFDGELRQGYKKIRHAVIPTTVDIKGPNRILKDIAELTTDPIPLDEAVVQDFEADVRLTPIRSVQMPGKVHVAVEIAKHSSQQVLHNVKMFVLYGPERGLRIVNELPDVSVTLYGSREALQELGDDTIRPFIDISSITGPGEYRQPVHVWIDGQTDLTAEYVQPKTVDVILQSTGEGGKGEGGDGPGGELLPDTPAPEPVPR